MRHKMLSPITSNKHYVHIPVTVVVSGSRTQFTLVDAIARGAAVSGSFEVTEGATVKAVYIELWIDGVTASKTVNACVLKRPASVSGPTAAQMSNMGSYPNKKNVLEFHQGLAPTEGNQMALFRHWIKIPKGKQRFGLDDLIVVIVNAVGTNVNVCGFCTFKEYT